MSVRESEGGVDADEGEGDHGEPVGYGAGDQFCVQDNGVGKAGHARQYEGSVVGTIVLHETQGPVPVEVEPQWTLRRQDVDVILKLILVNNPFAEGEDAAWLCATVGSGAGHVESDGQGASSGGSRKLARNEINDTV